MANENPNGSQNNNRRNDQNDNKQKGGFPSWLILLAIVLAITIFSNRMLTTISGRNSEEVRYDQFLSAVNQDEVAEVTISNEDIRYVLRADKDKTFTLIGSADKDTGTKEINQRLSEQRMEYVYNLLKDKYGIDPSRLVKKAEGDTNNRFAEPELNRVVIVE